MTLAELRRGVDRLTAGRRRERLDSWLRHELPARFGERVLPVTAEVADAWGQIVARREALGRPISIMDAFIGATANVQKSALVTRNESDFESVVANVVNPWSRR